MKKFSGLCLSFMFLIIFLLSGCTNADNAKLVNILDKYNSIGSNNSEVFCTSTISSSGREVTAWLFNPTYNSEKLRYLIESSSDERYCTLNSSATISSDSNFLGFGSYGILMQAVNVTFVTCKNIFSIIENDEIVEKQYKKNMYIALENLQENVKKLYNNKKSLEKSFNDSSKDNLASDDIVLYNLGKYKESLNKCLNNLLDFNRNLLSADDNNLTEKVDIDALWNNYLYSVTYSNNKQLVCNAMNLISQYVLSYSINIANDISENKTLLSNLAKLLKCQYNLTSETLGKSEILEEYKILLSQLDALKKSETSFNCAINELSSSDVANLDEKGEINLQATQTYATKLVNYSNRLIAYLEMVNSSVA